jgi:putative ABC transport system ATP-binding protein
MTREYPALCGQNLVCSYGTRNVRTIVVRNVSFELERGQVGLLMGPSGSGKSTLLSVVSGRVLVLGQDLWAMSEAQQEQFRLRHFGFIFQGYNLFPALTASQQLEMVLRWGEGTSAREARRRAAEMLDLLGLAKKAGLRPAQLSGGEKQRVAIGRALIKRPAFCFADEPTSALDWGTGEHIVELLRAAAQEQGTTLLVVSHDARIVPFADQVFHLEDGCLAGSAKTAQPVLESVA